MPTVWFTKYALTSGVFTRDVLPEEMKDGGRYVYHGRYGNPEHATGMLGTDAFLSEEDARLAVGRMVARKIAAVEKQLKKLREMAKNYPLSSGVKKRGGKRSEATR